MAVKKKGKGTRKTAKQAPAKRGIVNASHQVWLAGLGALARAQSEGPKLFENLVQEGSAVHEHQRGNAERFVKDTLQSLREAVETRVEGVRDKATETLENLEQIFQVRVKKALQQLGMPTSEEIHALSRKVNELNRSVQALTRTESRKEGKPNATAAGDEGAVI
jgi:poly(hydroxyalkanoate) granule-associated protein